MTGTAETWNHVALVMFPVETAVVSQIYYLLALQVNGYHAEKILNLRYLDMFTF